MEKTRTCETCYYRVHEKPDGMDEENFCVRFPPHVFPMHRVNSLTRQPEIGFVSVYPNCPGNFQFCGEWLPIDEEEVLVSLNPGPPS